MKRIVIGILAFAASILTSKAQENTQVSPNNPPQANTQPSQPPRHHDKEQKKMMMKELNLTPSQRSQMRSLDKEYKGKMNDLQSQNNIPIEEMNAQRKAMHQEKKAKMESILTPQQKTKLMEMRKQMKQQKKMDHANNVKKMRSALGLSKEQVGKIKSENKDMKQKMMAIKSNNTLPESERKQQMRALKNERKAYVESVLTADQKKKLDEIRGSKAIKNS